MSVPVPAAPAARLRFLLRRVPGLDDEAVGVARSLPPALATEVVVSILEAQLSHPDPDARAIRAAHLVHALGLHGAVPVLVRCVEQLPVIHPVRDAALSTLSRLGSSASEALLAALERSTDVAARTSLAEALAAAPGEDERVRTALVRMLEDAPASAARLLARRGEWRALPHLGRALDRLAIAPVADCPICAGEDVVAVASAIRVLGGETSDEQEERIDRILDRGEDAWIRMTNPLGAPALRRAPLARTKRPGRNDPCPCGSGKKYKRCHLRLDELEPRH
ncbi:MAG TPA: SEC-C metal-binding domain-containing protein [Anaeromyxobacter sp.]